MKGKIFKIFYIVIVILFVISWMKIRELPKINEINIDLFKQPTQVDTTRENFSFLYKRKNYLVKPVADYELWGLVVTQNNINAWFNFYHDKNSVNLKDVCVVWGKNIENEVYRDKKISYKSGEWTCYYSWWGKLKNTFYGNNLSNNHLLTAKQDIQQMIRQLNIGDQIYLKGSLVDYVEAGQSSYRITSISRDDENSIARGGGACEIVYVDEMKVLKKNQSFWHFVNNSCKVLFIFLITIQLILFIRESGTSYIKTKKA